MDVVTAPNDVVLGDDWIGPGDAVESEVRATRARRGLLSISSSPLARKITLFNLLALIILVGGILFTNPFRDSLLRQQEEMLGTSVQIVADIVAAAGGVEQSAQVVAQRIALDERFELLFFDAAGPATGAHARRAAAATVRGAGPLYRDQRYLGRYLEQRVFPVTRHRDRPAARNA